MFRVLYTKMKDGRECQCLLVLSQVLPNQMKFDCHGIQKLPSVQFVWERFQDDLVGAVLGK